VASSHIVTCRLVAAVLPLRLKLYFYSLDSLDIVSAVMVHHLYLHGRSSFLYVLRLSSAIAVGSALPAIAEAQVPEKLPTHHLDPMSYPAQDDLSSLALVAPKLLPTLVSPEVRSNIDRYEFSGKKAKTLDGRVIKTEIPIGGSARTTELAQAPSIVPPIIKPQPAPSPPPPTSVPAPPPLKPSTESGQQEPSSLPDDLCLVPEGGELGSFPQKITADRFKFSDGIEDKKSKFLDKREIEALKLDQITEDDLHKEFQVSELVAVAAKVAKAYADHGYRTSGAIVCIPRVAAESKKELVITIRIIKGKLIETNVVLAPKDSKGEATLGSRPPLEAYIKSRLGLVQSQPLNIDKLQEALQFLQFDSGPLLDSVTGRLSSGVNTGESILDVTVIPKKRTFGAALTMDNSRVPSVGSMQRRTTLREANLLGFGDSLSVGYGNSKGSNSWDFNYAVPLSPRNTTLSLNYSRSRSSVIEAPFDDLDGDGKKGDIRSASQSYEISLRHPIMRRIRRPRPANEDLKGDVEKKADAARAKKDEIRGSVFREAAVGITGSLRNSQTSLLDIPFPLSPGANEDGFTRIFALRFFQEFTQQDAREVLFLRSQFNLGMNALGSTINEPIPVLNDAAPDSRFFSWLGQGQWTRRVGNDPQRSPLVSVRGTIQLADQALLSSEQVSIGGVGTVRGYRQDILQSDNGIFATAELQVPVFRVGKSGSGIVQLVPFLDYGKGWNSAGAVPTPNALISTGVGLRFQYDQFTARLDWGLPLISVASKGDTWQDKGIHFSLQWNGF
jgi:hemolysin activation/secretion protein